MLVKLLQSCAVLPIQVAARRPGFPIKCTLANTINLNIKLFQMLIKPSAGSEAPMTASTNETATCPIYELWKGHPILMSGI
jgi:hypothetical protein